MILQALLSIAFITIVTGALLTSALVNAKVAAHETAARIAEAALARGTDEFVNWAQLYVAKHGAATTWPTTRVVDQPVAACAAHDSDEGSACNFFLTVAFRVVGSSIPLSNGPDPVFNLQAGLEENRISGLVDLQVTNESGQTVSSSSRLVTIRVFDAPPFAIVAGERSSSVIAGSISASEGDSGGYHPGIVGHNRATPDPSNPSVDKDTSLSVSMSCQNSESNGNQASPFLDNHAPGNDFLPWGASGGTAFESPCAPLYLFSSSPSIPLNAALPSENVYDVGDLKDARWASSQKPTYWPRQITNHP